MATAEAPSFADNIKTLGESIVKLTVLEAKALGDYLEVVHGIKPAAAAVAVAGPAAGRPPRPRPPRRRPSSTSCSRHRRQQDQRHQGRPRGHQPGPQGGQGPGRGGPQGDQDRHLQGRCREAQEGTRGRRRDRQDQVICRPRLRRRVPGRVSLRSRLTGTTAVSGGPNAACRTLDRRNATPAKPLSPCVFASDPDAGVIRNVGLGVSRAQRRTRITDVVLP